MANTLEKIVDRLEQILPLLLYSSIGFLVFVAILSVLGFLNIKLAIPGYLLAFLVGVLTYLIYKSKLQALIPRTVTEKISFLVVSSIVFAVALTLFQLYVPIAVTYSVLGSITPTTTLPALTELLTTFGNALLYSIAFYVGLIFTASIL